MRFRTATANTVDRRHKAASWLALSALLFNLLAGLFLPISQANAAPADGLSTLVVCTPSGLRTITLDADGLPLPDQSADASFCAFCLPLMAGGTHVPTPPVIAAEPVTVFVRGAASDRAGDAVTSVSLESRPPRAPPSFV